MESQHLWPRVEVGVNFIKEKHTIFLSRSGCFMQFLAKIFVLVLGPLPHPMCWGLSCNLLQICTFLLFLLIPRKIPFWEIDPTTHPIPRDGCSIHGFSVHICIFHAVPSKKIFWYLIPYFHLTPGPSNWGGQFPKSLLLGIKWNDQLCTESCVSNPLPLAVKYQRFFARNCMKYPDLQSKIMYGFVCKWGSIIKNMFFLYTMDISYDS